ncbi:MAG: hypothetical protein AVDCRST_MAG16-1439, partial [uncultured Frankineae bacterium]
EARCARPRGGSHRRGAARPGTGRGRRRPRQGQHPRLREDRGSGPHVLHRDQGQLRGGDDGDRGARVGQPAPRPLLRGPTGQPRPDQREPHGTGGVPPVHRPREAGAPPAGAHGLPRRPSRLRSAAGAGERSQRRRPARDRLRARRRGLPGAGRPRRRTL